MEESTTSIVAGNCGLNDDLVIEILSRVPVKPLARFRCVSKPWNRLLNDPAFIKNHLVCQATNDHQQLVFHGKSKSSSSINLVHPSTLASIDLRLSDYLPIKETTDAPHVSIIGSCNGLLCVTTCPDDKLNLFLFNPATRESVALPRPQITIKPDRDQRLVTGFGFNPNTNDYEVMRCLCFKDNGGEQEDNQKKLGSLVDVEVYSKNSGVWTKYTALQESFVYDYAYNPNPVAAGGVIHCMGHKSTTSCPNLKVIVGFDLKTRRFIDMKLPDYASSLPRLTIVGGSFGVFLQRGSCIDVWAMKEYGVEESWRKQVSISLGANVHGFPRWSTCLGEVVMRKQRKRKRGERGEVEFFSYDPLVKKLKPVFVSDGGVVCDVECYTESLVSVK